MKLSMWMIADWLKKYTPATSIEDGLRNLQNVRLFSEDRSLSRTTVYLSKTADGKILCLNGHDMLVLNFDDINQVLNDILDAFEYYSEWDAYMSDKIAANCTAEELLAGNTVLPGCYLLLADATFLIYAQHREANILSNPFLTYAMEQKVLPIETLLSINQYTHIRVEGVPPYTISIPKNELDTGVRNLFVNHKHYGWLVAIKQNGTLFTQGELDIIDQFGIHAENWLLKDSFDKNKYLQTNIFYDLLTKDHLDKEKAIRQLQAFGWKTSDRKQLLVIRPLENSRIGLEVWEGHLKRLDPHIFYMEYLNDHLLVMNRELADRSREEKELESIAGSVGLVFGRSPVFFDIFLLRENYEAACISADYACSHHKTGADFSDAVLSYSINLLKNKSVVDLVHPVLHTLEAYDRQNHTDLLNTLRTFLKDERNYTLVSKEMSIHRSTLIYRIGRIEDLTGLNLEDADLRFYLLMSFYLL